MGEATAAEEVEGEEAEIVLSPEQEPTSRFWGLGWVPAHSANYPYSNACWREDLCTELPEYMARINAPPQPLDAEHCISYETFIELQTNPVYKARYVRLFGPLTAQSVDTSTHEEGAYLNYNPLDLQMGCDGDGAPFGSDGAYCGHRNARHSWALLRVLWFKRWQVVSRWMKATGESQGAMDGPVGAAHSSDFHQWRDEAGL